MNPSVITVLLTTIFLLFDLRCAGSVLSANELKSSHWRSAGQERLEAALKLARIESVAKNVIFFLGDGMGIPTVTAMRIYKGQKNGKLGEEEQLVFDEFPHVSLSKTYGLDRQVSDSANTATAYFCGVKANYETLAVDGRVKAMDCKASLDESTHLPSLLDWAQKGGKRTGIVTTTRVTHATPAALYAHSAHRYWEGGTPDSRCQDIAHQLVHNAPGKDINVVMGGGVRNFISTNMTDRNNVKGSRNDSRDLLQEWRDLQHLAGRKAESVFDYDSFQAINPKHTDYLLGLFDSDHIPFVPDRAEKSTPTLVEMTTKAIEILKKSEKGFFLAVEGGRIDSAHHLTQAQKALEEGLEFDAAIEAALKMTDREDTLVIVTADHSHTMTIGGDYPVRGSNIIGLGGVSDVDHKTMLTLSYANGPGFKSSRINYTESDVVGKDFEQDALYPMTEETHGGEDVAVYAVGPMAHLFHGVHDQSYIPYVVGYAACIGPNQQHCGRLTAQQSVTSTAASQPKYTIGALVLGLILISVI